jgi:3-oxoacyl-[acyl-carrier-protein] synthase-3
MRLPQSEATRVPVEDEQGNTRFEDNLFMDGPEIFTFTLRAVPALVENTLHLAGYQMEDIDFFVFHQANGFMLESLRRKIKIPRDKFILSFQNSGNTVSSTIPIALGDMIEQGILKPGHRLMLVGFGVGYSWGATIVNWA